MTTMREERGSILHAPKRFGASVSGIPLEVYLPATGAPDLLIVGAQHGDEPETSVLLSHALRRVHPSDLTAAVVLVLNPDGLLRGTRGNLRGVDLNRNFPTSNWSPDGVCYRWTSDDPRDVRLATGAAPGSEPETAALLALVAEVRPKTIISVHAPLACVDDPAESELGRALAARTGLELVADVGYPTPGSFGTWCGENGKHVITFELPHQSIEALRRSMEPIFEELMSGRFKP